MPLRVHLESVERQTGKPPDELIGEPCPELMAYIWRWFLELNSARINNGFGPAPLSYSEILAWSEITGNKLSRFEARVIKLLDNMYLEAGDND